MCGIIGILHRYPTKERTLTAKNLAKLAHRGPDGQGILSNEYVALGHVRLSILDLSAAGRQPMQSQDKTLIVTYNGEIYNYLELKLELEALGVSFATHSDTEVLLAAYQTWGTACVDRFRGMFAFALWDHQRRSFFLARDRCGEKPLFYYRDETRLVFASELKGLLPLLDTRPALDVAVVDSYLHYQFVPEPQTLLKGIHKLPAAHTLMITAEDWWASPQRYWCVEEIKKPATVPAAMPDILTAVREGLEQAVTLTLRSDVPVGIALSGGIDSGAIAALAQKHYPEPMHAFCVGYPGRPHYDERHQARALAESLGMIVHEIEIPVESFVNFFPNLVSIMDEPIADPAAFGHYSVPKAAADNGIKVLLSGIGGDEVFWGYPWVSEAVVKNQLLRTKPWLAKAAQWTSTKPAQKLLKKIANKRSLSASVRSWAEEVRGLHKTISPIDQLRFYTFVSDFRDAFSLKKTLYGPAMRTLHHDNPFAATAIGYRDLHEIPAAIIRLLFDTWLASNCLTLGDRVSMSVGVETRLPFLDVTLIEQVMALRAQSPDHHLGQKAWLRAALKGILPEEVLTRPKAGFQPPVHEWLSGVVARYGEILRDGVLVAQGILDKTKIETILGELPRQGWPGLFFAYKLLLLEMWYQRVVAL
jgi:asparagine synthase (glutamine-hydrolysing)